MATRRQRPALDAVPGPTAQSKNTTLEAFEDFRRRHSRQNKDIVIDNALRRTTVKTLQDEIGKLHVELLELRQANILLSSQVKRLQNEAARFCPYAAKDAIDQILAAIPALRQFRDSLGSGPDSPGIAGDVSQGEKGWAMEYTENPTATRPAAYGADLRKLGNLEPLLEASEYGSDDGDALPPSVEERKIRRISKGRRRTEIGSVALRSPRPGTKPPPSDFFVVDSPPSSSRPPSPARSESLTSLASNSPSPVKKPSKSPEKRNKRRRESGLISIPSTVDYVAGPASSEFDDVAEIPDWEEGRNVGHPPVKPQTTQRVLEMAPDLPLCGMQISGQTAGTPEAGPSRRAETQRSSTFVPAGDRIMDKATDEAKSTASMVHEGSSRQIAFTPAPSCPSLELGLLSEVDSLAAHGDDDIGRGRRARKSVNYKEPSLTKKMRKPDGVSVEDTLRLPRLSVSGLSPLPPGTPRGVTTAVPESRTANSKRALQHMTGPRRKSVLPRHGLISSRPGMINDDEDEVEDGLELELGDEGRTTPSDREDEYVPSVPSTPADSLSPPSAPRPPRRSSVQRTSPRKTAVKKPDGPGTGATKPSSLTKRISSSGSRGALMPRSEDNGQQKSAAAPTAATKPLSTMRRPVATGRRVDA